MWHFRGIPRSRASGPQGTCPHGSVSVRRTPLWGCAHRTDTPPVVPRGVVPKSEFCLESDGTVVSVCTLATEGDCYLEEPRTRPLLFIPCAHFSGFSDGRLSLCQHRCTVMRRSRSHCSLGTGTLNFCIEHLLPQNNSLGIWTC